MPMKLTIELDGMDAGAEQALDDAYSDGHRAGWTSAVDELARKERVDELARKERERERAMGYEQRTVEQRDDVRAFARGYHEGCKHVVEALTKGLPVCQRGTIGCAVLGGSHDQCVGPTGVVLRDDGVTS